MTGPHQVVASLGKKSIELSFLGTSADVRALSSWTFSSEDLGAADPDRRIYVCVGASKSSVSDIGTPDSVTIGGVSATMAVGTNISVSGFFYCSSSIWSALVPTGTTGDVVVTRAAGWDNCGIAVYRGVRGSGTAYDTATDTVNTVTQSLPIDVVRGGIIIAMTGGDDSWTRVWTGLTEDSDFIVEGGNNSMSTASLSATVTETGRSITISDGQAFPVPAIAASFSPV